MNDISRRVMTVKETAALIDGLSEYRLRQMCLSGQVDCIKAGRKILVTEEAVLRAVFGSSIDEKSQTTYQKEENIKSCDLSL